PPASCSACPSACTRRANSPAPASAWPACAGSWLATAAGSGQNPNRARAPPSTSSCPPLAKCNPTRKPGNDRTAYRPACRGQSPRCGNGDRRPARRQPRQPDRARGGRRGDAGLPVPTRALRRSPRGRPGGAAAGHQDAAHGRAGGAHGAAHQQPLQPPAGGDPLLLARGKRPGPELGPGRERLRGQAGGRGPVLRGGAYARPLLGGAQRAALGLLGAAMPRAPEPYRVLLIEDSRDDAELIEIALRDGGPAVQCQRAWSAGTVRQALEELAPQLVLSDLNLPGFSGVEALEQVRAHDPALPRVRLPGAAPAALRGRAPDADAARSKGDRAKLPALVRRLLPWTGPRPAGAGLADLRPDRGGRGHVDHPARGRG